VGFFCVALLAVVSYQWVYIQISVRQAATRAALAPDDILEEFLAEPVRTIPIADSDPQRGSPRAAAVLVVFSDFQCPHCGRLGATLDDLRQRYGDDLRIVFKHFPLSTDCNSLMKRNLHPRSCALAWATEAAHRQNKFWAFHDAAFAEKSSAYSDLDIQRLASGAAVDLRQFDIDRNSPAIQEKVSQDVQTGSDLKVRGTPTLFLNGRLVPDLTLESLEILVEHEVHPR
jgi:protein-disulfide isomerase